MNSPDVLSKIVAQTDYIRFAPLEIGGSVRQKEWHHFCVVDGKISVVLNLNLSGDTRPAAKPELQLARVILLVNDGTWDGDVDTIPPRDVSVSLAKVDLSLGHNRVEFRDDCFHLSIALQDRPVTLHLQLYPVALPLLMRSDTPIGAGRINWLVLPRLLATGTIVTGDRIYHLEDAPAYHDHNWGTWLWGHDFAWEWGFALPESIDIPWSLVFDRTTNRARNKTLELTLALWRGDTLHRVFTQHEIQVRSSGYLDLENVPKIPRVMALISPERTTDIPRSLEIQARNGKDHLTARFESDHIAQIVIPNETDLGNTIINEVAGRISLEGSVKGETIEMQGRGIFEFLT